MSSFLANSEQPTDQLGEIDDVDLKNSSANGSYLDKKIHPERQALTKEEQQLLIKSDFLALRTEHAEPQEGTKDKPENSSGTWVISYRCTVSDTTKLYIPRLLHLSDLFDFIFLRS